MRRTGLRAMMLSAAVLVTAAACSSDQTVTASQPQAPAKAPHVVFYAEGSGTRSAAVTMRTEAGGTIQKDVSLPMGNAETGVPGVPSDGFKRGDDLYVSLQNKEAAGSVTCRIEVTIDGKATVIDEETSTGAYKVVSCRGTVP